ncbi:hypothetical protein [Mycoplasmopsis lipofaciens]|uniref:hypothetical protein n=1 Tax=Mycoplasmopsis lipofaciens TaxID=114884 RepID=UPI00055E69E3|nr:hypothetical protein [Mycoplasmopsis lipofaciens]
MLKRNNKNNKLQKNFINIINRKYNNSRPTFTKTLKMTYLAFYISWFFLASFLLIFGYIPLSFTQLTYLPVIVVMMIFHLGFIGALVGGISFGMSSLIAAVIYGIIKYQYPDISVLPRIIMSLITYGIFRLLKSKSNPRLWKFIFLAIIATLLNQALVLSSQYIHNSIWGLPKGVLGLKEWIIVHIFNIVAEPILASLISVALYVLIQLIEKQKGTINKIVW